MTSGSKSLFPAIFVRTKELDTGGRCALILHKNTLRESDMAAIQPQIASKNIGHSIVITLMTPQIIEDAEIAALEQSLQQTIKQANIVSIVLNFENVHFLSSAVLRVLIKVNTTIVERQGKLRLCGIDPKILEVFKITRLNKVFDIRKDVDAAVESLK
jgi:anti-sigma B factor antagonist